MSRDLERNWFRDHLVAYRLGLLESEEVRRFQVCLDEDRVCRSTFEQFFAEPETSPPDHLPAPLIAAWPRTLRTLRGFERAMAQSHLELCARCRAELEYLGFDPMLPEASEADRASIPQSADSTSRQRFQVALFAWSGLATAAALLLVVQVGSLKRQLRGAANHAGETRGSLHVPRNFEIAEYPVLTLRPRTRALETPAARKAIHSDTKSLYVELRNLTPEDRASLAGKRVRVEITSDRPDPFVREEVEFDLLSRAGGFYFRNGGRPLEPGTYHLQFYRTEGSQEEVRSLAQTFVLETE